MQNQNKSKTPHPKTQITHHVCLWGQLPKLAKLQSWYKPIQDNKQFGTETIYMFFMIISINQYMPKWT